MDARNAKRFGELLRTGRWFGGLPESFQQRLLEAAVVRTLAKSEWLFSRGDPPSGLFAVLDGAVRITTTARTGKEVLLALMEAPMWFGEIAVIDRLPRTHDAVASERSVVLQVPMQALDAIFEHDPRHWRHLGLLIATKLRLTLIAIEDTAVLPIAEQLARRLLIAIERYGEWHHRSSRVIELRQEQLATMLSTSRQTVNHLLKDLEGRGLVRLSYRQIEVVDLDGLRHAAGISPAPARRSKQPG
jgi:CRP/FNR family transcriptional regulator, cyclic AMP receptor protein